MLNASRTWMALVHHPVYDRDHNIVTTAITNLDVHDLARSSRTYGLAGYILVTPITAQRALAEHILGHWRQEDRKTAHRAEALSRGLVVNSVDDAIAHVTKHTGKPRVVMTTARPRGGQIAHLHFAELDDQPTLLLFGTGWGLADSILDRVDHCLAPIRGGADYNHLSVRSAAAITLDRLFGERESTASETTSPTGNGQGP